MQATGAFERAAEGRPLLASVIVTNFNYARFLASAVHSALDQTYPHTEVFVVDDGSTDDSREVITAFGDRIKPVLKENGGQASAFNAGFRASSGDVIFFLDADDLLLPSVVEKVIGFFENSEVAKVHWPLEIVDQHGRKTGKTIPSVPLPEGDLSEVVVKGGPSASTSSPTTGNAWGRWFLERVLPIPESLSYFQVCGDEYLFNLAPVFGLVGAIHDPQGQYRIHGKNIYSSKSFEEKLQFEVDGYEQQCLVIHRFLSEMGIRPDLQRWEKNSWFHRLDQAVQDIANCIPERERFILVDNNKWGADKVAGRSSLPFLERDGQYWGPPPDDETAISELERLREFGIRFIVFAWPAFWWLDHYAGFRRYLKARFNIELLNDRVVVFRLRESAVAS